LGLLPDIVSEPVIDPGRLTICVYTFTGAGKSTFCSRVEGVVIVQLEPRLKGIKAPKTPFIQTWSQLEAVYEELKAGNHPYTAVALDTVTDAYRLCAEHVLKKQGVDHETEMGSHGEGYGRINREFHRLIRKFAGLPYGLIMTAHVRDVEVKTKTEKYSRKAPDLPDTPRGVVMSLSDFVLYGDTIYVPDNDENGVQKVDENERPMTKEARILRTKWSKYWDAKDGYSVLPDIIPLSYPAFLREFKKGVEASKAFGGKASREGNVGASMLPQKEEKEDVKSDAKAEVKAVDTPKAEQNAPAKTETDKPENVKPEPKSDATKPEAKNGIKPDSKTDAKPEQKSETKAETKVESKPENKPGAADTTKPEAAKADTKK